MFGLSASAVISSASVVQWRKRCCRVSMLYTTMEWPAGYRMVCSSTKWTLAVALAFSPNLCL